VHLYHYSDMQRDLKGTVASMAAALGIRLDDAKLTAFAEAASFGSMKRNADQFAPESGTGMWKAEADFFANGTSQQWKDKLNAQDLDAFDARLAQLLSPEQVDWMLDGSG